MGLLFSSLFERMVGKKKLRILMVGLDAAGKTTILHKLKLSDPTPRTLGFSGIERKVYKNISFISWVVGPTVPRGIMTDWYENSKGMIFVVDSNDLDRIETARDELHSMLNDEKLRDAVLLVFANKQDLPNAMSTAEMTDKLGLNELCPSYHKWYIQACCATTGDGLYKGLEWLSKTLGEESLQIPCV